jgi:hypothetical protein
MCSISTFPVFTKGLVVLKTEQELESCPVPGPFEFISLSSIFQEAFGKRNKTRPGCPPLLGYSGPLCRASRRPVILTVLPIDRGAGPFVSSGNRKVNLKE